MSMQVIGLFAAHVKRRASMLNRRFAIYNKLSPPPWQSRRLAAVASLLKPCHIVGRFGHAPHTRRHLRKHRCPSLWSLRTRAAQHSSSRSMAGRAQTTGLEAKPMSLRHRSSSAPYDKRCTKAGVRHKREVRMPWPYCPRRPNPSIERTCCSGLRPLPHAAHVKRVCRAWHVTGSV